ncbi:MAG: 50S ribosomal protein L23 [Bacteroidetes bacterium]|nr:MAG: 50S ribosomal protein L23 [Bacteroidota bacterium]
MSVLKRPIITEKSNMQMEWKVPQYTFEVDINASKAQIKKEVERVYEVKVENVRTLIVRGKARTRYSKRGIIKGKSPNFKKAVVTLSEGNEIDFYKHI